MANKIRKWSKEELEVYGLKDCEERFLPSSEVVEVICRRCGSTGKSKLSNLISKMITYKLRWCCLDCQKIERSERAKEQIKENGIPFAGQQHTDATKQKMRESSAKRWEATDQETKNIVGEKMRQFMRDRCGGNPMSDPEIKDRWRKSLTEYYQDKDKVAERSKRVKETCMERYGASTYISSDHYTATFSSKGEDEVREFIGSLGLLCRKRRKDHVEIDIFVEEKQLGIEYNGLFWHSEARVDKDYHLNKKLYCDSQGIQLVHLFENEWKNRNKQVKGRLRSLLGCNEIRIGARECEIKEIESSEAIDFINEYHIQPSPRNITKVFALFYKGEVVAVASFGLHHRDPEKTVLNRFVTKENVTISGGLSRLSQHASRELKTDILSWCDLRWSNGAGYVRSGWELDDTLLPDYFYIKNGYTVISKQSRRKSEANTPEGMTEHQHALNDGLLRVYDCGKLRFVYRYTGAKAHD